MRDDHARLAKALFERGPYKGWEFDYEHPGFFVYFHPASQVRVMFTPDWGHDGKIAVQSQWREGVPALDDDGAEIPFPIRTVDRLFEAVRPWLDKHQPVKRLGVWHS